jgi:hypothetical protein
MSSKRNRVMIELLFLVVFTFNILIAAYNVWLQNYPAAVISGFVALLVLHSHNLLNRAYVQSELIKMLIELRYPL